MAVAVTDPVQKTVSTECYRKMPKMDVEKTIDSMWTLNTISLPLRSLSPMMLCSSQEVGGIALLCEGEHKALPFMAGRI